MLRSSPSLLWESAHLFGNLQRLSGTCSDKLRTKNKRMQPSPRDSDQSALDLKDIWIEWCTCTSKQFFHNCCAMMFCSQGFCCSRCAQLLYSNLPSSTCTKDYHGHFHLVHISYVFIIYRSNCAYRTYLQQDQLFLTLILSTKDNLHNQYCLPWGAQKDV